MMTALTMEFVLTKTMESMTVSVLMAGEDQLATSKASAKMSAPITVCVLMGSVLVHLALREQIAQSQ